MAISIDSRTLKPGDVFIPIKGPSFDGHDFIPEAIKKGATILDVDLPKYAASYRKKLGCAVIAVTGSAGKTTVKDLLYAVLSQKYRVVKTEENQNNEIGAPLTLLRADFNTDILIVELGMRGLGQIQELARIVRPTHAVITSIGLTHVELLGNQRNIAKAKAEVFLPPLKWEKTRTAFLNFTTPYYDLLAKKATQNQFTVLPFKGADKIDQNINLCYAVGQQFGLSNDDIATGLKHYQGSAHRLQVHHHHGVTLIDDTYNANPDGVSYALQFLRRFSGRKIFVFGDMLELGTFAPEAHQAVVDQALDAGVDLMFTYGPLTRAMHSDTLSIDHFKDKASLNTMVLAELKPGDVVLFKGSRGMKLEETLNTVLEDYHG
ncbi:MAG: UDP-N-acetylmuramoyl-tripeptide--D-alanyl-D-alanine ligase [Candidatus Margulisiibacteriota bacterium]